MKLIFSANSCLLNSYCNTYIRCNRCRKNNIKVCQLFCVKLKDFFITLTRIITKDNYCAFILRHINQYLTYECYFFYIFQQLTPERFSKFKHTFRIASKRKKNKQGQEPYYFFII